MIFVTIGTLQFDELIMAIDRLVAQGLIQEEVIFQIGSSKYIPRNGKYFRYDPNFINYIKKADLIITHGGATVLILIAENKPFIAVPNTSLADNHQFIFLKKIADLKLGVCCFNIDELPSLIQKNRKEFKPQKTDIPNISSKIAEYLLDII